MNFQGQFCPENSLISTLVCAYLCVFSIQPFQESVKGAACLIFSWWNSRSSDNKLYQASTGPWELQEDVDFRSEAAEQDKEKTNSGPFEPQGPQGQLSV